MPFFKIEKSYLKVKGFIIYFIIFYRQDQNLLKDNLDRTAIGDRRKFDDSDIFAFRPLSTDVPDLELPDFLPDLPGTIPFITKHLFLGVALDVVMTDLQGVVNKTFQDYEQKVTLPDIEASGGTSCNVFFCFFFIVSYSDAASPASFFCAN